MNPSNEDDAPPEDVADILRKQAEDEALAHKLEEQAHTLLPPEIVENPAALQPGGAGRRGDRAREALHPVDQPDVVRLGV